MNWALTRLYGGSSAKYEKGFWFGELMWLLLLMYLDIGFKWVFGFWIWLNIDKFDCYCCEWKHQLLVTIYSLVFLYMHHDSQPQMMKKIIVCNTNFKKGSVLTYMLIVKWITNVWILIMWSWLFNSIQNCAKFCLLSLYC